MVERIFSMSGENINLRLVMSLDETVVPDGDETRAN